MISMRHLFIAFITVAEYIIILNIYLRHAIDAYAMADEFSPPLRHIDYSR